MFSKRVVVALLFRDFFLKFGHPAKGFATVCRNFSGESTMAHPWHWHTVYRNMTTNLATWIASIIAARG